MSTYKKEVGTAVQNAAGTLSGVVEGQLWYDSTAASFKYQYPNVTSAGAWSTGNNMNTAKQAMGTVGSQTAALAAAGDLGPAATTQVESYDGTSWTEITDVNTARLNVGAAGIQTSALIFSGNIGGVGTLANTESWNGSAWTEVNDVNQARQAGGSAGRTDNTSALFFGGVGPGGGATVFANTESWNGTSWTEVNDLNTARYYSGSNGTPTSALNYGGNTPPVTGVTESYNGTSWTEVADLNTARGSGIGGAGVDNTSALAYGGQSGGSKVGNTELYNGSTWTETTDLSTARELFANTGTQTAALAAGGAATPALTTVTEEWLGPGQPIGAWSTGGSLNTARQQGGAAGISNSASLVFGGAAAPGNTTATESYDGTSWTEVNDLNTARVALGGAGS